MHPEADSGKTLGRYILTDLLGEGGMGTVYKAHDPHLQRYLAAKVMHVFELATGQHSLNACEILHNLL
jgi:eukaryotic-like serine/threonine-protein kinase